MPALEQAELINVESEAELSEWDSQDDLSRLSDESFISQSTLLCDSPKHEENDNRCNEYNENTEKDCVVSKRRICLQLIQKSYTIYILNTDLNSNHTYNQSIKIHKKICRNKRAM